VSGCTVDQKVSLYPFFFLYFNASGMDFSGMTQIGQSTSPTQYATAKA
jgi:hypothetical protein